MFDYIFNNKDDSKYKTHVKNSYFLDFSLNKTYSIYNIVMYFKIINILIFYTLFGAIPAFALVDQYSSGGWTFRIHNSFATSNTALTREYPVATARDLELTKIVHNAAANYTDHTSRMAYLSSECSNLSELEIIQLGRFLSGELATIYDYQRAAGGSTEVISTEDQWTGLHNLYNDNGERTEFGVCRDMSRTVSEFLLSCGIDKNRISIEDYRTADGGHQVVRVLGEDGHTYTINWSELYQSDDIYFQDINPKIINTGIVHTRYDAQTGRIIDERMTELGHILATVTGGKTDDPNFLPELLQLEANYSVMTAGLYKAKTSRGDFIQGVKLAYKHSPLKWLHLSSGVTYAKNKIDYPTDDYNYRVEQDIIFLQAYGKINIPNLEILKNSDSRLYWANNIDASAAGAIHWTKVDNLKRDRNHDETFKGEATSSLVYEKDSLYAILSAGLEGGANSPITNTEDAKLPYKGNIPGVYLRGRSIEGMVSITGDALRISTGGKLYSYSYGEIQSFFASIDPFNSNDSYRVQLTNYEDVIGQDRSYLDFGVRKELDKDGRLALDVKARVGISPNTNKDKRIYFNLQYKLNRTNRPTSLGTVLQDKTDYNNK